MKANRRARAAKICTWKYRDDKVIDYYRSSCGEDWSFTDGGGPKENRVRFCQWCGRPLNRAMRAPSDRKRERKVRRG